MKCVACGSTNLIDGKVLDESGGSDLKFKPSAVSMWKAVFGFGVQEISAAACVHCGHLHLNVNFSDEDRGRYLQFEGRQPDLLARLESES